MLTYNRTLPNISQVVTNNGNILQINPEFGNVLINKPTIVSKRNKKYARPHRCQFSKGSKSCQEEISKTAM